MERGSHQEGGGKENIDRVTRREGEDESRDRGGQKYRENEREGRRRWRGRKGVREIEINRQTDMERGRKD